MYLNPLTNRKIKIDSQTYRKLMRDSNLNPEKLDSTYQKMYDLSNKYILIAEYYSKDVREILYRGHSNKLFKRDFCGEIMDKFKDLKLIDYGFVYYRDSNNPLDDISWFLLEKY